MSFGSLASRQGAAVVGVAERLLGVRVGDRIPTVTELSDGIGVGSGTVQAALRTLRAAGAVSLSSHGHLGTLLVERDLALLWRATGGEALRGVLPLPTSPEFAGLATGLADVFQARGIRLNLTFRQGGRHRLAALEAGDVDFTVCSMSAADEVGDEHRVVRLAPETFYAAGSVVVITRAGDSPDPRGVVPVDRASRDHELLTEAEFPDATLTDVPYTLIPELVIHREADAAIWHRTSVSPLLTATGLDLHPRTRPTPRREGDLSSAALVLGAGDGPAAAVLDAVIDPDRIAAVQREVLERRRVPSF
jgi:hypothetical protein